ncbi:HbrB-like-domain-containing protein [Rhodocollybia butyracea]|uniref:HbrB-like-domain-containing protein n=1 Tax=Rhodocollybia butyracea TaxID=206335 RepID=A0A9P5TYC1_9AGAR|nr:HbrB-like-domain-containing protein [Rhodocollybia butyracea]
MHNLIPTHRDLGSGSALNLPSSSSIVNSASSSSSTPSNLNQNDPWGLLHVNLLPLFNGEPLKVTIEDLNSLVKRHISSVVSSSPSKALLTLENDTAELLSSGMVTLNAKLSGIEDDKLISRVVELWGFFWDQVLTYVEGSLLPLQTDPILTSLSHRAPKRPSSPTRQTSKSSLSLSNGMSPYHIDVRTVALRSFRDKVILPLFTRLYTRLSAISANLKNSRPHDPVQDTPPRMQQMLLVLSSQSRPRPQTLSLSLNTLSSQSQTTQPPSTGEAAISDLLRVVRSTSRTHSFNQSSFDNYSRHSHGRHIPGSGLTSRQAFSRSRGGSGIGAGLNRKAPNFLDVGAPRDRRGRVAGKQLTLGDHTRPEPGLGLRSGFGDGHYPNEDLDISQNSEITMGMSMGILGRERDFLESLRSPDLPPGTPTGSSTTATITARASIGGWGLGAPSIQTAMAAEEDEPLNWDEAQAEVERMVGMTSHKSPKQETTNLPLT